MNLWAIFLTGLTVGGLTCLAVQGGLLASAIAAREESDQLSGKQGKHTVFPILAFITTKFIVYTLLGFLLGLFGAALQISDTVRIIMQILAGVYMLLVAANLLNLHPIFRYVIIQPPRFLYKLVRNQSKSKEIFAPALLGAMTIFIPCGTTLAMEALAISSGNPIFGASIMAFFVLGTIPLFFGIGFITTILGDNFKAKFFKLAALGLVYLGLTTINASLVLAGSPITIQTIGNAIPIEIDLGGTQTVDAGLTSGTLIDGAQTFDIAVSPTGYNPNIVQVKAGTPVKLNLATNGNYACTSIFRIPSLGISKTLPATGTDSVLFTPQNPGQITWTCAMGMYTGTINVI